MVPYKNTTIANATAFSINQALHLCYIMWDVMCGLVMSFIAIFTFFKLSIQNFFHEQNNENTCDGPCQNLVFICHFSQVQF